MEIGVVGTISGGAEDDDFTASRMIAEKAGGFIHIAATAEHGQAEGRCAGRG
jgi:hypothetical protein